MCVRVCVCVCVCVSLCEDFVGGSVVVVTLRRFLCRCCCGRCRLSMPLMLLHAVAVDAVAVVVKRG